MIKKKTKPAKFEIMDDVNKKLHEQMMKPIEAFQKKVQQLVKPVTEDFKHRREIMDSLHKISKHDAEKYKQPFLTNELLESMNNSMNNMDNSINTLNKSQTPKWVNYTILVTAILSLLMVGWTLISSYI